MKHISLFLAAAFGAILILLSPPPALASALDLYIPSISGDDSPPGFPGAMRLNSLSISPNGYSLTKALDSGTPQIANAVAGGTPLSTTHLLLYNVSPPGAAPTVNLSFPNTFATSSQIGVNQIETDTFAATVPTLLYMDISGITGADPTPGHPNAIRIQSLSLSDGSFSIAKTVDPASPQILAAVASGTPLSSATLMLYGSSPAQQPYATIQFQNVFATASQQVPSAQGITEQDMFSFTTLTPEPGAGAALAVAVAALVVKRPRRNAPEK